MKTQKWILVAIMTVSSFAICRLSFGQGALTPPGAPAPTMKTLSQIEPRTPISLLPYSISSPGSYYLTTNLSGSGNGIVIASGNVALDLNGFTLQGLPGSVYGILVNGTYTNITVRNGVISGWGNNGVDTYTFAYPRNMVFENLTVSGNGNDGIVTEADSVVRDCLTMSNHFNGIESYGGRIVSCLSRGNGVNGIAAQNCDVQDCRAEFNGSFGILLIQSRAFGCTVETNGDFGIYCLQNGNEIRNCLAFNNSSGIFVGGYAVVSDCTVFGNGGLGIAVGSSGSQIVGNNCISNANFAIDITCSNSRIDNNSIVTTGGVQAGIIVPNSAYTNNVIIRNTVVGSGIFDYSISGSEVTGPIITTPVSGVITNSNPWANFSF